ncbi:hypothetical protein [Nostoc sp. MS1]|nr:hypothetical protein [Nostoc sp. MS1]
MVKASVCTMGLCQPGAIATSILMRWAYASPSCDGITAQRS